MKTLPSDARDEFNELALKVLEDQSKSVCKMAASEMAAFCADYTDMGNWWDWWWKRRHHIFRAYKPVDTPFSNLAEVGHAQMAAWGKMHTTLLQAAADDVCQAVRQKTELAAFLQGQPTGGQGITVNQRLACQHRAELRRADELAAEVFMQSDFDNEVTFVPKSGVHRPPARTKRSAGYAVKQKRRIPKLPACRRRSSIGLRPTNARHANVRLQSLSNTPVATRRAPVNRSAVELNPDADGTTFHVCECAPRIKKCYGCKKQFDDICRQEPTNLILRVICHRYFTTPRGVRVMSPMRSPAYPHLKVACMQKYYSAATMADIVLEDRVRDKLTDEQVE